ncbi:hypothetical protein AN191_09805 [Loktanella sp. 5RATIMAR09]|uniref:hypothetical protein n=1 Tax=Loktanella sp. 5RATIMAR09 TaxID=1225655 RepID=UPI000707BB8B|nr:hypothetical protein [Loktanella sp. 5RATIMAR09]KQI72390.1 hypothetical protein AN191_09805 [Loktanella sp. 5RATIMAR09]
MKKEQELKTLKDYISEVEARKNDERPETVVFYHFDETDRTAEVVIRLLLNEAKPRVDLGKGRAIIHHKAHIPNNQDHLHFEVKGTRFAAINKDGTAHDRSHGIKLQRWAVDGASKHYPDFRVPKDGLIEDWCWPTSGILNEDKSAVILPPSLLIEAEQRIIGV